MAVEGGPVDIRPHFEVGREATVVLRWCARQLRIQQSKVGDRAAWEHVREKALRRADTVRCEAQRLRVCVSVLCDLALQGWQLSLTTNAIRATPPVSGTDALAEKERVRAAHHVERDRQLAKPATRRFIQGIERRRLTARGWKSISSLMRDGSELSASLAAVLALPEGKGRSAALKQCVDPYIQFVDAKAICEHTGLRLADIWRYFRYTWATAYQSTPGRKMFILVRDRARENHPVIGIAALGSTVVQLSCRDRWIGWTSDEFIASLRETPTAGWARWLERSLDALVDGLYLRDLVRDGLVARRDLRQPTSEVITRLREESKAARTTHRLYAGSGRHKKATSDAEKTDWQAQAKTHLFRSKRAAMLAELLEARLRLKAAGFTESTQAALTCALESRDGRRGIQTVLRYVKAMHAGVDMLDITVCGAIAPYTALLGGKLIALLMASPEVVCEYERRYRRACSLIASSMAGEPIRRAPKLVLLGTTSLYGVASSQYNRLSIPASVLGGPGPVRYELLGRTRGFGSYHFSEPTMTEIELLAAQSQRGRQVNSIFGEGINPKFRKIRGALDRAGLPSDGLLLHGSPRLVYGVALAENFRSVLLGRQSRPKYFVPVDDPSAVTRSIVEYWQQRWMMARAARAETQILLAQHRLSLPIQHGARVSVPREFGSDDLFSVVGT